MIYSFFFYFNCMQNAMHVSSLTGLIFRHSNKCSLCQIHTKLHRNISLSHLTKPTDEYTVPHDSNADNYVK